MLDRNLIKEEFSHLKGIVFLNVASVVMPPKSVLEAYYGFTRDYVSSFGEDVVSKAWGIVNSARKDIAQLINSESSEIAFVKNTCEGIGIIANGYPFKSGENVVVVDQEHSSNLFAWINLQRKGVELRVIPSRDGEIVLEDIISAFDSKTRAVSISAVQFSTGFYSDLYELGQECKKRGIIFIVDGIQAIGRMNIDVRRMNIDYLACGGNKGLLATLGAGFVYCSMSVINKIIPPYVSYQSVVSHAKPPAITTDFTKLEWHPNARRLESGNLNYAGIAAIQAGVKLINRLNIAKIEKEVLRLEDILREKISGLPLNVRRIKNRKNQSGLVCVYYPVEAEERVINTLKRYNIYATMRGGYIRLGIDFYNTEEHMSQVAKALTEISTYQKT